MRKECQEAWLGIEPNLTERHTELGQTLRDMATDGPAYQELEDNKDITLDFRPMLVASGEELDASHSNYKLPRLAEAILWQCPHLICLSVRIGRTRFLGQYHEDYDDEDYITEEQWRVIGHILTLIEVEVEGANKQTILDLDFELYNLNPCFPHVVLCYGGASMMSLTINRNLLDLLVAKRTVDSYRRLFVGILNKPSIPVYL